MAEISALICSGWPVRLYREQACVYTYLPVQMAERLLSEIFFPKCIALLSGQPAFASDSVGAFMTSQPYSVPLHAMVSANNNKILLFFHIRMIPPFHFFEVASILYHINTNTL